MVDFDALADALEPLGWVALQESNICWRFIKQGVQQSTFRSMRVEVDGTVYLSGSHKRNLCPFRIQSDEWAAMNVVEQFVRGVEI